MRLVPWAPFVDGGVPDSGGDADADAAECEAGAGAGGGGDSCFVPVSWPAPCATEIALDPALAVPALEWDPCDWHEGCLVLRAPWGDEQDKYVGDQSVLSWGDGYRLGLRLFWKPAPPGYYDHEVRSVVFDEHGQPLVVWRNAEGDCLPLTPWVTPARVWAGSAAFKPGLIAATNIMGGYGDVATAPEVLPFTDIGQGYSASSGIYALWLLSGRHVGVYDWLTMSYTRFGPSPDYPDYYYPQVTLGGALMVCEQPGIFRGCMWRQATNDVIELVAPPGRNVALIAGDGETLVWIEAGELSASGFADPWLFTSPQVSTPGDLVPQKRRPAPPFAGGYYRAATEGYVALFGVAGGGEPEAVHVYRLADMHHWTVPTPAPVGFVDILHVDSKEVWYRAGSLRLVRQRLDALGPGDPAPPLP